MSTNQTFTCDTLVIGGGTAGAIIASRLAADATHSVVLLEAGPDYGRADAGRWPADLYGGRVVAVNSHDWNYTSAARHGKPNHPLERARVLGGCSAHNGCIAIWGSQVDYDGWAALGNPGWATADLLPYFHRANELLCVRHFAQDEVTPFHAAALQAIQQTGGQLVDNLNNLTEDDVEVLRQLREYLQAVVGQQFPPGAALPLSASDLIARGILKTCGRVERVYRDANYFIATSALPNSFGTGYVETDAGWRSFGVEKRTGSRLSALIPQGATQVAVGSDILATRCD